MTKKLTLSRNSRAIYLLFCIPFFLAFVSWQYFPLVAEQLLKSLFNYSAPNRTAEWLWQGIVHFFYTWYTLLAIGIAGMWAVAAYIVRFRQSECKQRIHSPMVSFIVPAYNEEKNISRCISSLFKCAENYRGPCEIIVVDDGSSDCTYEIAWSTVELDRGNHPQFRGRVVRHSVNLGKIEAIRTGVGRALGSLVAVVDADSWWRPEALERLVNYMLADGKKAVTGYVHPSDGNGELNPYVVLQQLEYSQGLGMNRCSQSLGDNVTVVSGAIGIYDADTLRTILDEKSIQSVTEDLEITLEMHKKGAGVGYVSLATSASIVPQTFNVLWNQRVRWFTGWLHNTLSIHKDLLLRKSWLTLLLWYCYIIEYGGAIIDLAALLVFPFLFWLAPDQVLYAGNLLIFMFYAFIIGTINQAIALKFAYNKHNYRDLLLYTPFYPILRLINIFARLTTSFKYLTGYRGNWH